MRGEAQHALRATAPQDDVTARVHGEHGGLRRQLRERREGARGADLLIADASPSVRAVWDELRIELNIGQYLDLLGTVRGGPSVESAKRICTYKSGKYTIERPLHLGAVLAAPEREDELLAPLP